MYVFLQFLYRQRMFDMVFPVLLEFIRAHIGEEKSVAALVAFAQVIAHSPKAVYLPHLAQIFPLMVQALNTDDRELGSAAIQTFAAAPRICGERQAVPQGRVPGSPQASAVRVRHNICLRCLWSAHDLTIVCVYLLQAWREGPACCA